MAIKKEDFIEITYTGKVKKTGLVFDTNDEKAAKESGLNNAGESCKPIVICVGEGDVLKGVDEGLIGKEAGKTVSIEVPAEKGFGKKEQKLVRLVSLAKFQKENIRPIPGLQLNFGNAVGKILSASGGRVMVDFNHPLAGQDLEYKVQIHKIVTDDKEKLLGFLKFYVGANDIEAELNEGKAVIQTKQAMPAEVQKVIAEKVKKRIPSIKEVSFKAKA